MVALTTATARLPGSSFNSRAASVLISETTVCGPHCISTCVITLSLITLVTKPTKRLRAELPMPSGFGGNGRAMFPPELGQDLPGDHLAAGVVLAGRQSAVVDPSPDGVVADP